MGEEKKQVATKNQEVKEKVEKKNENTPQTEEDKQNSEVERKAEDEKTQEMDEVKEIVMKVYMHCEGCARKIRKCLKNFQGVQEVITECKSQKVVVKGDKLDPVKVVERVVKKSHRQVVLVSPVSKCDTSLKANTVAVKETPPTEDTKQQPKEMTVVLKVHMHCEACSLEIKRRIERMKDVEEVIPDLKNSLVSVKGKFDLPKLVDYVYKRIGKRVIIVKQDPPEETRQDVKGEDGKDEKNGDEEENKGEEKGKESKVEKKEESGSEGGGTTTNGTVMVASEETMVELRRNVSNYNYFPPRYTMDMNTYPPQLFSDENPNSCFIM